MAYTFKDLKHMTVAQLREIAAGIEHEAVKGYTQLNKEHLLAAICTALGIDTFEHHVAKASDKSSIKAKIKELKKTRNAASKGKREESVKIRRKIKSLKKKLRKAVV
jgi:hypothetical protein